jgi:hypothetical protein
LDKQKKQPEIDTENKEANNLPWELKMMLGTLIVSGIMIALKIFGVF